MDLEKIASLQTTLLTWYAKNARDLPWRRTKDPYAIWVSEIMLQQTQVDTVIPYYEKWLHRFPTIASLARAPLSEVMKRWAGLGYYRRARMLHESARELSAKSREQRAKPNSSTPYALCPMPSDVESLIKLPGIGRYTAGAIASIAFDQKAPIVDGNVIRILTRIYAIKPDISKPTTIKRLWAIAEEVLPDKQTGDFNQAMMELGATVCLPDNPKCGICPVQKICHAHALRKETSFPVNKNKTKLKKIKTSALVLTQNGKVLIQKQPERDRWGGLWMFPHWRDKKSMMKEVGDWKLDLKPKMKVRHGFTKYLVTLEVFEATNKTSDQRLVTRDLKSIEQMYSRISSHRSVVGGPWSKRFRWVTTKNLMHFAMPSPHQKIAAEILRK